MNCLLAETTIITTTWTNRKESRELDTYYPQKRQAQVDNRPSFEGTAEAFLA